MQKKPAIQIGLVSEEMPGTRKRRIVAQELLGRFRSKTDFIKYFTECMQLYVPPAKMVNKDFIKAVLTEQKSMLPLSEVKWVNVPHYDELSVKAFLPKFTGDGEFMKYIPDITMESRIPARDYFWNILNTVRPEYVKNVIEHANNLRMKANDETKPDEYIEVSAAWWSKLTAVPFVSCK